MAIVKLTIFFIINRFTSMKKSYFVQVGGGQNKIFISAANLHIFCCPAICL
jgi:hypothetical protein